MHFVRLGIFFFALSTGLIRYQILMLCYLIWMLITYAGGSCLGWDIVRSCYLAVRVFRMFMLLATMEIWYLHDLLTIQSQTSNLGVT